MSEIYWNLEKYNLNAQPTLSATQHTHSDAFESLTQ